MNSDRRSRLSRRSRNDKRLDADGRTAHDMAEDRVAHVYDRHAGSITAYALRRASGADAADVVADTFMVAWRRHDEIPDEPNTLPWLYGIARRVLANQRRSTRRRGKLHERLRDEFLEFDAENDRAVAAEHFENVAAALARLSDDDAELLRLTAWEGLGPTEIAAVLDVEPGAVRQRLRRARTRLRVQLGSSRSTSSSTPNANGQSSASIQTPPVSATVDMQSNWSKRDAS